MLATTLALATWPRSGTSVTHTGNCSNASYMGGTMGGTTSTSRMGGNTSTNY